MKSLIWTLALAAILLTALLGYGNARWNAGTTQLLTQLDAAQIKAPPQIFSRTELDGLPAPVKRYFDKVLKDGQPIITAATVQHSGTFNMGETTDNWRPFTSTQRVVTQRPGFDWDARVKMFPGVAAHIHDAYVAGAGVLKVAVFGLISVANLPATPELAKGELMRFLAEAAWYPTALLPSLGVVWQAVDETSAIATINDGSITVTLRFGFSDSGLIDTMRAESRGRLVNGTMTYAPWAGRLWNYAERGGMLVPLESEVAWVLPSGPKPYYRGLMTTVKYDFASSSLNLVSPRLPPYPASQGRSSFRLCSQSPPCRSRFSVIFKRY